jgi:predicted RNase H-like nuclease
VAWRDGGGAPEQILEGEGHGAWIEGAASAAIGERVKDVGHGAAPIGLYGYGDTWSERVTVFVGLDLAWTAHRETGVCVLAERNGELQLERLECRIDSPVGFAEFCAEWGDDVIVAIDAPLVLTPQRRAEAELGRMYSSRHAGAYTATAKFLERMDAGPQLALRLTSVGFEVMPERFSREATGRWAFEVFPHPAHVELFPLEMALRYKKGRVTLRRAELVRYQGLLSVLLSATAPAAFASDLASEILDAGGTEAKGRALKNLEDRLDALTCALIAYHCWREGPAGFRVFGDGENGYIVVPRVVVTSAPGPTSP